MSIEIRPPTVAASDPLADAHAKVDAWAKEATAAANRHTYYTSQELKNFPAGQAILNVDPAEQCRIVLAAVEQARHWEELVEKVRNTGKTEIARMNPHHHPDWPKVWGPLRRMGEVLHTLLRRALPLTKNDLVILLDWVAAKRQHSSVNVPMPLIAKAVERFVKTNSADDELRAAAQRAAAVMRQSNDKDAKRAATGLEQAGVATDELPVRVEAVDARPVIAQAAGRPNVLRQLKVRLNLLPADEVATETLPPDSFVLRSDSPLTEMHSWVSEVLDHTVHSSNYYQPDLTASPAGQRVLALEPLSMGQALLAAAERAVAAVLFRDNNVNDMDGWRARYAPPALVGQLLGQEFTLDRDGLFDFLLFFAARPSIRAQTQLDRLLSRVESFAAESPLTEGERYVLSELRSALVGGPPLGAIPPEIVRLNALVGDGAGFYLVPDGEWSLLLNQDLHTLPPADRGKWIQLLKHWLTATASRPSAKWLKTLEKLVSDIGADAVSARVTAWLNRVPHGGPRPGIPPHMDATRSTNDIIHEENANALRGMLWTLPTFAGQHADSVRVAAAVAQSAYKKVPGVGPRAIKVGNAAIYALSEIGNEAAVGQLALLKVRVKFGTAQKEIEKAFNAAAAALGLPREEIEELGVPTYGLEEVGLRRESFGDDIHADLRVDGRDVTLHWTSGGKAVKSVPAKVKADFKEELKELQTAVKDITAMLPAQSERLDAMFLLQKHWPLATWKERYLDHPLVGTLARRMIWTSGGQSFAWLNGKLLEAHDGSIDLPESAEIALWHPIGQSTEDILAWRAWLDRHQIKQPFKQAHREIYPLTDAERNTGTYSNRFAAHVLRQHQFNALCAARGWRNKLRMMVDDTYPPATRELPQWNLRAEFWIEGIGENYGTDTNDSGAFLRVATDQVRFYAINAARTSAHAGGGGYETNAPDGGPNDINRPLPLEQVPPLVLSEIMRDVDLFVGVGSVGNDPTWQDGGPDGRFRTYWQNYSFGDLSETAKTRRAVLTNLLPRLTKLRDKWKLDERFLIIRGSLRTYKIHLGSGNILMEPNDQYLCIVPDRSASASDAVFLPFEGDNTLSIILSKAFLLAEDTKIKDATITRQIGTRAKV